ncbi:nucleolar and coiled-body phosphoprotein 1 isoform X2 [Leptopilina boulardi]|uniref:nucleolar and coiled-body phosphoprotein 1 isoform X2 n=1 Tax=Leptopilina boulardi TaxID=63433 RepID=UPI0021F57CFA|nr:nucleolar and coiled-body phosphoprotein 1 isoform X2 [Leptopilina boulardi]
MGGFAWVTLATNDSYSLGALVLAHSLKRAGTQHDLVALITPGVTNVMREKLAAVFSLVQEVNILDSKDESNLRLLARPELGITFTKLHCWRLTQYEKCVFVDADALVIRNCDELFDREELSAAPDVGWPDCFNSGVFVFKPSQQTYDSLIAFATAQGSFDGGDQGLLNMFFSDWSQKDISKHLPFIYNMCSSATYSYLPAFKQFGNEVRIIHFIGSTKPWLQYFDTLTGIVQPPLDSNHIQPLLQIWWNIFCDNVHPQLNPDMTGLAGALAQLTLGEARSNEQVAFEEHMRKQSWEQGQIDYLGRDSFDNIWKKISETLASHPEREISPPLDQLEMKKDIAESPVIVKSEEEEEEEVEKPATNETTDQKEPSAISAPITTDIQGSVTVVVSQIIEEPVAEKEKDSGSTILEQVQQIPISQDIPVSEAISVAESVSQSSSLPTAIPVVPLLETSIIPSEVPESVVISEQQLGEFAIPQETISKEPVVCQIPNLQPILPPETSTLQESQIQETSVQEKPVPIQVAESVLQAEPKESVSQVTSPVGEEAISSIVSVVQESALAISEALISPPTSDVAPKLENGCADHSTEILTPQIPAAIVPPEPLITQAEVPIQHEIKEADVKKEEEVVVSQPKEATETKEKSESKSVTQQEEKKETEPSEAKESQEVVKPKETKLERRKSSSMEKPLLPSCEPKLTVQIPQSKPSEISGLVQKPREERKKSLSSSSSTEKSSETETQQERRPMRSKEMKVPPTPTVTEATPPTSPPINPELVEGGTKVTTKKVVKKIVKKQSTEESEDAAEGSESSTGKKVTKKVVKKVVKKKESSEGGEGSTEKGKKIVKKGTQLETDKSVPETPPPASSEAPVPPKRKVKSSTTTTTKGTTSKKSDTEL